MSKRIVYFLVSNNMHIDQRMHRIGNAVSELGFDVRFLARKYPYASFKKDWPFSIKRFNLLFNSGKLFYLEMNIRYFFFLWFVKKDIVCSIDADTLIAGYIGTLFSKSKLGFDAHEYYSEVPELYNRKVSKRIWQLVEDWIIPKVDFAYTVNNSLAKLFTQKWGKNFEVIRNVPELKGRDICRGSRVLYYQGAVNKGRGLEQLIEALPHLNGYVLKIVGSGDVINDLKIKAKDLNVEKRVHFTGAIAPDKLLEELERASIGVNLLSNEGLNYYYSLANKFWDYCNVMLPQVSMNFPEYSFYNEQSEVAILIDELSTENIINSISRLEDKEVYNELKENALALIKENNWELEKAKLEAIYFGR